MSDSKRPPRIQVDGDSEAHSTHMEVVSREPSASIKAGVDVPLEDFDSCGPVVSQSSTFDAAVRMESELDDLSLRERNSLQRFDSQQSIGSPSRTPSNKFGIVTTTEKYGNSIPSSPQRSPRRTPRGSFTSKNGSGSSGQSLAARSVGGQGGVGGKPPTPRRHTTQIRELDRMAIEAKAPPRFICPISGRVMRDPAILATGTTCDRVALERRLAAGNKRCPVTNKNLRVPISMTPNSELRDAISVWARKNAPWMMDPTGIFLLADEPGRYELQGSDNQYVCTPTAMGQGAGTSGAMLNRTPSRTPSRTENGKGSWVYTNGSKARPGHAANGSFNMSATPGTLEAGRTGSGSVPWYMSRGIASPRSSRKMSRSRSSRHGSGSPAKSRRQSRPGDWFSLAFLVVMSVVYLSMFLFSMSLDGWKVAPMSENPWYGPSSQALVDAGALLLPLMNAPGNEWWRLFSSVFLPAGMIQMFVCIPFLWLFGHPARKSLPLPQASVAGVFLVSSLVGSMVSANLNGKYVACGAFSGVMSLMAVFCVDQAFSWPRNRLFNLKEWWLVALFMVCLVGGFFTISLFPLVDIWFSLGGFFGGLLLALVLVPMPRVQSQALGSRKKLVWIQALSGVALVGIVVAASVGLALTPKLGQSIDVLSSISCVEMSSSMECTPYGFLADTGCGLEWSHESSAVVVACPSDVADSSSKYRYYPSNATFSDIGNEAVTVTECQRYCDGRSDPISVIAIPPVAGATAEELMSGLSGAGSGSAEAPVESVAAKAPLFAPVAVTAPAGAVPTAPAVPSAEDPPVSLFGGTQPAASTTQPEATTATQPVVTTQPATTQPVASPSPIPATPAATTTGGGINTNVIKNPWGRGATDSTVAPVTTTSPTTTTAPVVDLGFATDTTQLQEPVVEAPVAPATTTPTVPMAPLDQPAPTVPTASPAPLKWG